VKILKWFHV